MASKVTIQDIADALGVSRNTVSKAINNTGVLAAATRDKVLKKAQEMGYKQFSYLNISETAGLPAVPEVGEKHEIALFMGNFIGGSHFASTMLDKFQRELAQLGYSLIMYRVIEEEVEQLRLPVSFRPDKIAGIACVEIFDHEYCRMLCGLNLPLLFIDSPADGFEAPLKADLLYMDNRTEIYRFVKEMVQRGKTSIGFVGPYLHCQSFYERYMSYRNAMYLMGLPCPEEYCLTEDKHGPSGLVREDYHQYLAGQIGRMKKLPDVFLCANDATALDVMLVLDSLGYSVPGDVCLCGFDDSPESRVVAPPLTTIHIHSQDIGLSAVQLLISRIKEPSLNYRTMYVETNLIFRESTEG